MNAFPLAPFLYALIADGISVSFGDYDRISTVLSTGDKWTKIRLRGVLTALLAHNKEEAERIQRRFDRFFVQADTQDFSDDQIKDFLDALRQAVNQEIPVSDAEIKTAPEGPKRVIEEPVIPKPRPVWSRPVFWCVIAGIILAGIGITVWIQHRRDQSSPQTTGTTGTVSQTPTPVASETPKVGPDSSTSSSASFGRLPNSSSKLRSVQFDAVGAVQRTPSRHRWTDFAATLGAFILLVLMWFGLVALISSALKDPPPQFNPNSPRVFPFNALGEAAKPQLDGPTLDNLADSINYFLSTRPSKRLDIGRTITETGRHAGMPTLCFHRQRQVRRVCIFEDSQAEPLTWNTVTRELLEGLSKRGLEVLYGRFAGSLDRFVMADGHTYWLDDLDNERRDSLFLFFSDGKQLGSYRDFFALERLARLPLVAWFDFREPKFWDETALLIKTYGIPLYQANAHGLMRAFDRFLLESNNERDDAAAVRQWRGFAPYTDGQLAVYIEHVLGDALVWAQACAMIQPLSLNMAHTLRRKFQPQLPPERIERLFRLPGTTWQGGCLRFSREVMAALRGGFSARLSASEQENILNFIEEQIRLLEPPKSEKSLRRLVWEWTLRRVQLESSPDEVLPILSQLSQTPLGTSIKWDMARLVFVDQLVPTGGSDVVAVPLRTRPITPKGVAYLKDFSPHIVMSSSLPKRLIFSWQRMRFIVIRVQRYVWSQLVAWWMKAFSFLQSDEDQPSHVASRMIEEARIWADPEEIVIKRIFTGESKTETVTFRTNTDLGLSGRIVSDNEWLKANPSYCDEERSEKNVTVFIDTQTLSPGKHAGNITLLPADNSEPIDVSVTLEVYRSWKDVVVDWWRTHHPKHPVRAAVLLVLIVAGLAVFTLKVLPGNWPNRIYNRPPTLHAIRSLSDADLPEGLLALEAVVDDAEGDQIGYQWTSDWGTLVGDWQQPIFRGSHSSDTGSIKLKLSLKDSRGGYDDFSTSVQFYQEQDYSGSYYSSPYYGSPYYGRRIDLANPYLLEEVYSRRSRLDRSDYDYPNVEVLLNDLKSDSRQRWIAASSLAYVTVERKQVIPALIKLLDDSDPNVVVAGMSALARFLFEEDARAAVPLLVDHLKHDARGNVRVAAASALTGFPMDRKLTVSALLEVLDDKDAAVAAAAANSLGIIGSLAKAGLIERLNNSSADLQVRRLAATALAGDGMSTDPDIVAALLKALNDRDTDVELRRLAGYSLAQLRPSDPQTIRSIAENVSDKSELVRRASVSVLWGLAAQSSIKDLIIPALLKAVTDPDAEVRRNAIGALGDMRSKPDGLDAMLLERLKDSDVEVRHYAAVAITKDNEASSLAIQVIAILKDPKARRDGAVEALGLMQIMPSDLAPAIAALKATLSASDVELRHASAYALAKLASKDETATAALIGFLTDPDPHLKNAAISAVWEVKGRGTQQNVLQDNNNVTSSLLQALHDESPFVRTHAAVVLGMNLDSSNSLNSSDQSIISALTKVAVEGDDSEVAQAAVLNLVQTKNFCSMIPELLKSRYTTVRLSVLERIERNSCSSQEREFRERLFELLSEDIPIIQNAAGSQLLYYVYYGGLSRVRFYYNYANRVNRETELARAREAWLAEHADWLFGHLQKLLSSPRFTHRIWAVRILSIANGQRAFPLIISALHDADPRVRRRAVMAIAESKNVAALPYLEAAVSDLDLRVHYTALVGTIHFKKESDASYTFSDSDRKTLIHTLKNADPYSSSLAGSLLDSLGSYASDPEIDVDKSLKKICEIDPDYCPAQL